MSRNAIRALSLTLGLAMFLALPTAEIFGTVPTPQQMSGYVSCDECSQGPTGPYRQCYVHCWSNYGWCVDQCYAYADTCQLSNCICLPC